MYSIYVRSLKKLITKFSQTTFFSTLFLTKISRVVISRFPRRLQAVLLSGALQPRILEIEIASQKFLIYSSIDDDHFQSAALNKMKNWESEVLNTWQRLCFNSMVVVDVGAYLGVYSLLASTSGAERVVAYEPNNNTFARLKQTLSLNSHTDRILVRDVALSDKSGTEELMVPKNRKLSSGAQLGSIHNLRDKSEWEVSNLAETVSLKDDLFKLGIERIDAIKIDAEGSEMKVIQGAIEILKTSKPAIIVELLNYSALAAISEVLGEIGYGYPRPLDGKALSLENQIQFENRFATNYLFI